MAFFNPKEDVIDIELTQYGKRLLAKGEFKPTYYQFFDDDILYDVACIEAGADNRMTELQNQSEPRIQENTPRLRPQYSFVGVDNFMKKTVQTSEEKVYALPHPLGTSKVQSEYAPSFSANFWNGSIASSSEYLELNYNNAYPLLAAITYKRYLNIPQINADITYNLKAMPTANDPTQKIGGSIEKIGKMGDQYLLDSGPTDKDITVVEFGDDTYLHIEHDYILLEMGEENSPFLRENFDIEVYEVDEVHIIGNWKYDRLKPLHFASKFPEYDDRLLLDENDKTYSAANFSILDPSYVEYFFEIEVDEEIDTEVFCRHRQNDRSKGLFVDRTFDCPDVAPFTSESIYGPPDDEDGDICED